MRFHSSRLICLGFVLTLAAPLRSAETEVVYSLATTPTGSQVVAPYPAVGTDFLSWFANGGPGPRLTTFSAPAGRSIRTVTLDMGDAPNPAGGFSLSLVRLVSVNNTAVLRLEIVTTLIGSANPATAGKYTYEVPPGIEVSGDHGLLAQVAPGGGSYQWNASSVTSPKLGSGGMLGILFSDRSNSATITGPFNPENVVFFVEQNDRELLFEVTADKAPAALSVEPLRPFAPVLVGREGPAREVTIANTGGLPLDSLSATALGSTKRNFRVGSLPRRFLDGGETTTLEVAAKPERPGRLRGRIKIDSSAGFAIVRLRGRGLVPPVPPVPPIPPAPPIRTSPRSPLAITGG